MVDRILASFYASVSHDLAHIVTTPIHGFPEIVGWIFGDDGGFSAFAGTTHYLGMPLLPYGQIWQKQF